MKKLIMLIVLMMASLAMAQKPNIVFIFIDDMGYGDIGPFGSTVNKTPELDRMAAEGMKLTQFYDEYEGIRRGPWKLVRLGNDNNEHGGYTKLELYNLDDDLAEATNRAEKNPEIAQELNVLLDKHMATVQSGQRPAAFGENPRPLLESTAGVPALTEYMGFKNLEAVGGGEPPKSGKKKKKK